VRINNHYHEIADALLDAGEIDPRLPHCAAAHKDRGERSQGKPVGSGLSLGNPWGQVFHWETRGVRSFIVAFSAIRP
jgi:hypothetical protein